MNKKEEIKYSNYEYDIAKFDIIINGKKETSLHTAQIRQIYIEKDFDNDILPVMLVQLSINIELYYKICQNANKTKFLISIYSQKRHEENDPPTNRSLFMSGSFDPIIPDGTPFTDEEMYKDYKESTTTGEGELTRDDFLNEFTFILSKRSNIIASKKIINKVLTSSNMTDAVTYLLSSCGLNNVLMSTMDNHSSYSEVILLPIGLADQIRYLDNTFGFYKHGMLLFFDFDTIYLLRKCPKCTAYRKNELVDVIFHVYKMTDGKDMDKGSYITKDGKKAHIALDSESYYIDDGSETSDSFSGANTLILNDDSSVSSATTENSHSFNILTTTSHNKYAAYETKLRLKENKLTVNLGVKNFDLKLLAPNKHYKILCDDSSIAKKLQHNYRLSGYTLQFISTGDTYSVDASIQLKSSEA